MLDLNTHSPHPFDYFQSHKDKPLRVHTNGVVEGVARRTLSKLAAAAALFHDLGKLNPNFQPKLLQNQNDSPVTGYSSHAYLSALALLCFCKTNPKSLVEHYGLTKATDLFGLVAMIAHHHGNLPNFNNILSESERGRLTEFISAQPVLPISDYLRQWLKHEPFDVNGNAHLLDKMYRMTYGKLDAIQDKLDYYLETQFSFSCLVESDKRDAGNNKRFVREEQLAWAASNFSPSLAQKLGQLKSDSELNMARTDIRNEALGNLERAVQQGHRTFSLTAPTGAGKTLILLALADAIRRIHPNHSVIYALPFLTITEQVEKVCQKEVFTDNPEFVSRIDSRAQDPALERLMAELETQPEKLPELMSRSFSRDTFDSAFIITTFVQLFETLLSNRGSALLRMPNFSRCIFLIDEIQALPPRLYVFFTAYLQAFCERYDSYAILSTATMPALKLPGGAKNTQSDARLLFTGYKTPEPLLDLEKYYALPVFNRYVIKRLDEGQETFTHADLTEAIQEEKSCLVILNTIDDTKRLYRELCPYGPRPDVVLLNTHFILDDRREKIKYCRKRLEDNLPIILISTQLIEAGVDIDFPAVFRDLCPLPSLIQSAGRCNRNGNPEKGIVWFFELKGDRGETRAELVYRDPAGPWILDFSRQRICGEINEEELLCVQEEFFDLVNRNLAVGDHPLFDGEKRKWDNLIQRINELAFGVVGSFRLIDEREFGVEHQYYVPKASGDNLWEALAEKMKAMKQEIKQAGGRLSFQEMKKHQVGIDDQLRQMTGRVVQVRVINERDAPPAERAGGKNEIQEICGLRKLCNPEAYYSYDTGIDLQGSIAAIF